MSEEYYLKDFCVDLRKGKLHKDMTQFKMLFRMLGNYKGYFDLRSITHCAYSSLRGFYVFRVSKESHLPNLVSVEQGISILQEYHQKKHRLKTKIHERQRKPLRTDRKVCPGKRRAR